MKYLSGVGMVRYIQLLTPNLISPHFNYLFSLAGITKIQLLDSVLLNHLSPYAACCAHVISMSCSVSKQEFSFYKIAIDFCTNTNCPMPKKGKQMQAYHVFQDQKVHILHLPESRISALPMLLQSNKSLFQSP